jgi:hypothetical protein
MSLLSRCTEEKEFDVRITPRKLSKGLMLQDELEKHCKKLIDDGENADYANIETLLESVKGHSGLR